MYTHVLVCVQANQSQVSFSTALYLIFEMGSPTEPRVHGLARVAGQQGPGIFWSRPLQHQEHRHTLAYLAFYVHNREQALLMT